MSNRTVAPTRVIAAAPSEQLWDDLVAGLIELGRASLSGERQLVVRDAIRALYGITERLSSAVADVDRRKSPSALLIALVRYRLDQIALHSELRRSGSHVAQLADDLHARMSYAHAYPDMVLYTMYLDTREAWGDHDADTLASELPVSSYEVASHHSLHALLAQQRGLGPERWIGYQLSEIDVPALRDLGAAGRLQDRALSWIAPDVTSCRSIIAASGLLDDLELGSDETVLTLIDGWEGSVGELLAAVRRI